MRAGAGAELVDEVHRPRDRGGEPDAVVGPVDVVVHRLGDRDHRDALVVEAERERQRVVPADRDHRVDAELLDHAQHVRRCGRAARRPARPARNSGSSSGRTFAGLVRDVWSTVPPVRSIVRTDAGLERPDVLRDRVGIVRVAQQPGPSAADARRPRDPPRPRAASNALMHAFRPGTSPPPVRIPIFIGRHLRSSSVDRRRPRRRGRAPRGPGRTLAASASGTSDDLGAAECDHPAPAAGARELDGGHAEPRREDPVRGVGASAALHVPELGDAGLPARRALRARGASSWAIPPYRGKPRSSSGYSGVGMVPSSGTAPSATTTIENECPRWWRARRSRADLLEVERALGDQDHVGAAGEARLQRDPAGAAAHHLDEHQPVVALGRRVQPVDRVASRPAPRSRIRCTRRYRTGRCRSSSGCR